LILDLNASSRNVSVYIQTPPMMTHTLHALVKRNALDGLRAAFAHDSSERVPDANAYDEEGYTPLMHSVIGPKENPDLVQFLLDQGADVHLECRTQYRPQSIIALALGRGNPTIVELLLKKGANIHYTGEHNYRALVDAVHGRCVYADPRLLELLNLLIKNRVDLSAVTSYRESGLRVLSRLGRFDAVKVLLDAGADGTQLEWTPLMHAVAHGSLDDVTKQVSAGASLEERDYWERTPWLLSLQTGDPAKARYLFEVGGDLTMRGRSNKTPLIFAIESRSVALVRWLIEIGAQIGESDGFFQPALNVAVETNNLEIVEELIKAGADLHRETNGETALSSIRSREMGSLLLSAGGDPHELGFNGQRIMLKLTPDTNTDGLCVSQMDFDHGWPRKCGKRNPERINDKFCESMIRTGISASLAASAFECKSGQASSPIWCAQRFGQSITFMPDGRIIQIGGEHEDYYDKDFCIYNDVFVHHPNGEIELFGYPEEVFPPTDFHSVTLLAGCSIWIIGGLGYAGKRLFGKTPVFRLDTKSMEIRRVEVSGECPGWIYGHVARIYSDHEIRVSGGKIVSVSANEEIHGENFREFILDVKERCWCAN
jgi:ankyrin repeat protein